MMRRFLLTVTRDGLPGCLCCGQASAPVPDQTELIKSLLERIDKLEKPCGPTREQASVLLRWLPTDVGHDRIHSCALLS